MPTRLGNILRAAEDYPLDRYEINAIVVWPRLYAVLPDSFTAAIAAAKLPLDLMAVIGALAAAFTVAGTVIAAVLLPWYAALACGAGGLLACSLAYAGAVQSARPYAQLIRAGFDVHRGLLLDAAGDRPAPTARSAGSGRRSPTCGCRAPLPTTRARPCSVTRASRRRRRLPPRRRPGAAYGAGDHGLAPRHAFAVGLAAQIALLCTPSCRRVRAPKTGRLRAPRPQA